MAITPNYSWPLPDDTDLVKNGALAIRSLGNAIDTTVNDLGVGLSHIVTTDFTASSSESFNDVFSATYDNYRIVITGVSSVGSTVNFRLRASGVDSDTASSYIYQRFSASDSTLSSARVTTNLWQLQSFETGVGNFTSIDLANPFLATRSSYTNIANRTLSNAQIQINSGTNTTASSFDGFSIFPASGNITGTVSIYGYAKA